MIESVAKNKRGSYHHGNLREAVLRAAVELVERDGPAGVSMRAAARIAGVSSGAPFRHFEDKAALMTAVADEGAGRLVQALRQAHDQAPDEPAERFRAMGIAYVCFAVENPGHFRVMHMPEYASPLLRSASETTRERMRALIVAGQATGAISQGDPDDLIMAAHALVYGLARMFVDGLAAAEGIADHLVADVAARSTGVFGSGVQAAGARATATERTGLYD